jgi:shikimate 5-dehydrogenase
MKDMTPDTMNTMQNLFEFPNSPEYEDKIFGHTIVVGVGATAGAVIPHIRHYSNRISVVTRESENARHAVSELQQSKGEISSEGYVESMKAKGKINKIHIGIENIEGIEGADTVFLCSPNDSYA